MGSAHPLTLLVAVVVLLAGCGGSDPAPAEPFGSVRTPPLEVGDVVLPDESPDGRGEPFAFRAEQGGLLLVYFGYTSCPDICPTTLSDIGAARRELVPAQRSRVDVALVTFDPARDTGEVMSSFLDHFVEGGHALRSDDTDQLAEALDAFRVVARRSGGGDSYDFEHTAMTYVVDENGTVVLEWAFGTAAQDMAHDLGVLLDRIDHEEPLVRTEGD